MLSIQKNYPIYLPFSVIFFPNPFLKGNSPNYNLVPQFFEITFLAIKICCI